MEQHLGLQGAHLTTKNTTLARLQLVLTDDALKGELRPEACSSLLLECAVSCQSSTWPLLWRHYKTAVSLLGGVSEAASEALWRAAIKASYVAHAVEIFKDSIARQDSSSLKGLVAHQRKYSAVISQLLKVKSRGLANKQLAYGLWREIYASARESKRYAIDLGGLDAVTCRAGEPSLYISTWN
jgi:ABC-type transporter Mla MlaB component